MDNPYSNGQHSSGEVFFGRVVTMASPPEEKVRLFRAMFRGREDVYARRYVSAKSGKSGYSPVCAVEWAHGLCDKKRVSCAVCPNRRLLPIDDEVVRQHLRGVDAKGRDFTLGCYPLPRRGRNEAAAAGYGGGLRRSRLSRRVKVLVQGSASSLTSVTSLASTTEISGNLQKINSALAILKRGVV